MGDRGPLPKKSRARRNKPAHPVVHVDAALPEVPADLAGDALDEWHRVVPQLDAVGILTIVDRAVLVRYCTAWGDWCEVDRALQQSGKLIKGDNNTLIRNPLWPLRSDLETVLSELGKQLALNPVSRIRNGVVHRRVTAEDEDVKPLVVDDFDDDFDVRSVLRAVK